MSIVKSSFPILEYDTVQRAVLMPRVMNENPLPRKCVFVFLGESVDNYAQDNGLEPVQIYDTITKDTPIYIINYKGEEICFCRAPLGSSASVQFLDHLISNGCREIFSCGSCGALVDLPENEILVPTHAIRDEGASYHYLPPSRKIELNPKAIACIKQTLTDLQVPFLECETWTTDGFFRETPEMIKYRLSEGCSVVKMECAGLAACAQFRGIVFGQFLFTADCLADFDNHGCRDWGKDSHQKAFELCLEIAYRYGK